MANAILVIFHLHSSHPQAPITNYLAMQLLVFALLLLFFAIVRARLSVDDPGALQHVIESINSMISDQSHEVIGHGYERYVGYLTTLGLFILVGCLIGLVPGFETATRYTFGGPGMRAGYLVYYHFQGIRLNGFSYIKNFIGPVWWLAPLMFVIEVCSHLAHSVAHHPSFCQHVCQRHGDPGVSVAGADRHSDHLYAAARRRRADPDIHFCVAGDGLHR